MTRRQLWSTVIAFLVALLVLIILYTSSHPADAASPDYCTRFANEFAASFKATVDRDLNPYFKARAYSTCLNSERVEEVVGDVPAPPPPDLETAPVPVDPWAVACAKRFKSFDPVDGTVRKYRARNRVPCPVKPLPPG